MTDPKKQKEDYDIDFERVVELVSKYEQIKKSGEIKKYNEESTKKDFILPLFEALGWNVDNRGKSNDSVSAEESISKKRVDYGFRISGIPKFFLEAKSLKEENIQTNHKYITQAIDYAWMKSCSWAILTNFETIAVYNADWKDSIYPNNFVFVFRTNDFLTNKNFLYLSKKAFENNELDNYAETVYKKQLKNPINKQLLQDMIHFREVLSKDIVRNNHGKNLTQDDIDESVQRILDRLIFIRNAEDRGLEENQLQSNVRQWYSRGKGHLMKEISRIYADYDRNYNSKLFAHHLCDDLYIDNEALQEVIEGLNHSKDNSYRYDFSIIESDVLGNIYEQYLGNILKSTHKRAKLEESKTHRKEQGIYYTPSYIVDYIVKNTVGEYIKTHTPEEIRKVRILDPACGSGSFLIKAYKELEGYWSKYYEKNKDISESVRTVKQTKFNPDMEGNEIEFYSTKTEILKNNIFGVDLDPKAVEIAQLNLLLQISEKKQRLPLLQNNIKVGNSLIDDPTISDRAFKWEEEFPEIMNGGGFNIVFGNPPYGKEQLALLRKTEFNQHNDIYSAFLEEAKRLLKSEGFMGFITPVSWQTGEKYKFVRNKLLQAAFPVKLVNLPYDVFPDAYVDTCIVILSKKPRNVFTFTNYSKTESSNELSDADTRAVTIRMKDVLNDPYKRILPGAAYYKFRNRFNDNSFMKLGDLTISIRGPEANKYRIAGESDLHEAGYPFFQGNVYRYSINKKKNVSAIVESDFNNTYRQFYTGERILVRRIINRQDRIMATLTNEDFLHKKDLYVFKSTDTSVENKYLLSLINSKLFSYIYVNTSTISLKDDFRQTTLAELRRLPVLLATKEQQTKLSHMVDQFFGLLRELQTLRENTDNYKEKILQIQKLDEKIDEMIYKLYEIKEDEVRMIEKRFQPSNSDK